MNILFLDIDGVLNSEEYMHSPEYKLLKANVTHVGTEFHEYMAADIDPIALNRLKTIIQRNCSIHIVVSSSWRKLLTLEELRKVFEINGWTAAPIIGKTKNFIRQDVDPEGRVVIQRGHEIQDWIERANKKSQDEVDQITKYAILDDDSDFLPGQPLVQTSWKNGLQDEQVEKVLELFK